jgi:8-oxo-dGTP diphosphatase
VSAPDLVRAAGGIVIRDDGDARRVAVVHRPRYDDWSFPKGKLLDGEPEEVAALREVEEETGLRCRLGPQVGAVTYADRHGRPKIVRYWQMTPEEGTFEPSDEVDELRWLRLDEADRVLSYPHDRDVLRSVIEPGTQPPIYVVRHAKAGLRTLWEGPDEQRPLTRRGRRQAQGLVDRFRGLEVQRIVSSPFVRCVQSVEPLATSLGLAIETATELGEGGELDAAVAYVRTLGPLSTVLCGHGREIEGLVRTFEGGGAEVEGRRGIAKGSVWVLERREGRVVSARYLPAPPG